MTSNLKRIRSLKSQPQPQTAQEEQAAGTGPLNETMFANNLWQPPALSSIEDTGLSKLAISDLVLKALYFRGDMVGHDIAREIRLPFNGLVGEILEFLKHEKMIEIMSGSGGFGGSSYRYSITGAGMERAMEALRLLRWKLISMPSMRKNARNPP